MNLRTSAAALSVRVRVIGVAFCVVAMIYPPMREQVSHVGVACQPPACVAARRSHNWGASTTKAHLMRLDWLDWSIIALYFAFNVAVGLYYKRRASRDTAEFFLSGRNVPWWLAGTSMVATTFAADTPLVVTGLVARNGIAGNWLWWNL